MRDALVALSLANLSFIALWNGLLNYTPAQTFFLGHAPPPTAYAAVFANVILLGSVFFLLIRLARWMGIRWGLVLIALPACKSVMRLFENLHPTWELRIIIGMFAMLLGTAAFLARGRFLALASTALIAISPLILVEAVLSIARCRTDHSEDYAEGPLAPRLPSSSCPRIVWIIFDELDYRLSFPDRPSNLPMPSFDRLRAESLFAEHAISPANDTLRSLPALMTGNQVDTVLPQGPKMALFNGQSMSAQPNIFSVARALGANTSVVGWYLPYCRLFSQDLVSCSAQEMETELTVSEGLSTQLQSLFAYGHRSLLGESPGSAQRIKMIESMRAAAVRDVADPDLQLVFLHLPVPHPPYLWDRSSHAFAKRYLSSGSYFDNLALTDIFLGDIENAMAKAGLWDKTTVVVSSDHPNRSSMQVDGKKDPRVPFLLKLAGQTSAAVYLPELRTIVTKPLLEQILNGKITTPQDAMNWLATGVRHSQ